MTLSEAARELGICQQTASHWMRVGLVTPERKGSGRQGHELGTSGLRQLVLVMFLREAGRPYAAIREGLAVLQDWPAGDPYEWVLEHRASGFRWRRLSDLAGRSYGELCGGEWVMWFSVPATVAALEGSGCAEYSAPNNGR